MSAKLEAINFVLWTCFWPATVVKKDRSRIGYEIFNKIGRFNNFRWVVQKWRHGIFGQLSSPIVTLFTVVTKCLTLPLWPWPHLWTTTIPFFRHSGIPILNPLCTEEYLFFHLPDWTEGLFINDIRKNMWQWQQFMVVICDKMQREGEGKK